MTENSREERARRRTLSVIEGIIGIALIGIALTGFVLGVLFCCPMSLGFLMLMFPEQDRPDRPIDRIQFEDAEYMLICRTTLDGPIDLQLYECEQGNQESCLLVEEDYDWGIPCEDYTLRTRNGLISVETKSGYVLFTYNPK